MLNIQNVGVVGLGLLGQGIVTCLLSRGIDVTGLDLNPSALQAAREHIAVSLQEMVSRGAIEQSILETWPERYHEAVDLSDFRHCDFIIESIVEHPEKKQELFKQLEEILPASVTIGSNTSALPITLLQQHCRHPERIVGMHWAEPCHLTRFLEVIRGEQTSDGAAHAALQLGQMAGKDPALVEKDVPGFIVNRLGYALYREAFWLLENGVADVDTIDKSFRNAISVWANIAGPFRWMDLTGLEAYAAVMERLFPQLNNQVDVPQTMRNLIAAGAQGVANGHGFYQYGPGEVQRWTELLTENVWQVNEMLMNLPYDPASINSPRTPSSAANVVEADSHLL